MKKEVEETQGLQSCTMEYLLHLLRCALNDEPVSEKPASVSWEALFKESKRQSVLLLAHRSIAKLQNGPEGEIGQKWAMRHDSFLTKGINQTLATEQLIDLFNAQQIKILPMKGYYLRKTYPVQELREMTDLDLLVEADSFEKAKQIMSDMKYELTQDHEVHTSYVKPPYLMVELHKKLLPDYVGHGDYYDNIWQRAQPEETRPYVQHINPSDTFIHIMLHFVKHYLKNSSCGIRFAIDFYTYCRYYDKQLDWAYIWQELDKLKVKEMAQDVLGLGQAWFADGKPTQSQEAMGKRMCSSGTFGNTVGYDHNQIMKLTPKSGNVKVGEFRYFMRMVFPPIAEMKISYPILEKIPILLPFTWIIRGFRTLFTRPNHIKKYYKRTKNAIPDREKEN